MVTNRNEKVVLNQSVGTVDYDTGKVCVGPLNIADTLMATREFPLWFSPMVTFTIRRC